MNPPKNKEIFDDMKENWDEIQSLWCEAYSTKEQPSPEDRDKMDKLMLKRENMRIELFKQL
jgi:hypothetical protein